MLDKIVSKNILLLLTLSVAACASTADAPHGDAVQDKAISEQVKPANATATTDVVPALDEATKKGEKSQQANVAEPKLPDKANQNARVAQVKKIMKAKLALEKQYEKKQRGADPNAFYRFKREKAVTRALIDDGVHDPAADLQDLQPPVEALKRLPTATFGNGVNWVAALNKHEINPRADQTGSRQQFTMDMNILMVVPGTMNNILFPHKAHTAWLACSNCHTAIFQMKRGGNPITMKKINKGEYCGVCHGKVAFPIANCNRCHSIRKQAKNTVK